jgi:hypothetical protein
MLLGRTLARYEMVFPIKSVMPQEPPFYRFYLISYTILLGKTAGITIRVKRKTLYCIFIKEPPIAPLLMSDPTFKPTIFYVEGGIFNFAFIQIVEGTDGKSYMLVDIIGADVIVRPNSHLDLIAQ